MRECEMKIAIAKIKYTGDRSWLEAGSRWKINQIADGDDAKKAINGFVYIFQLIRSVFFVSVSAVRHGRVRSAFHDTNLYGENLVDSGHLEATIHGQRWFRMPSALREQL